MTTIGERIKKLRKAKGLTQEQLAEIIGVERSSVGKYEGKKAIIPSDDVKEKLADFFGVSLDYLSGREAKNEDEAEVWAVREQLRRDPNMRILFDAASKASPDHLRAAAAMLKALEPEQKDDDV